VIKQKTPFYRLKVSYGGFNGLKMVYMLDFRVLVW
jgi:hypothetical protein